MEAEALTELALQVATVASVKEARGKQHDSWRLRARLRSEKHARQTVVLHRRRIRSDGLAQPCVELAGGHALVPGLEGREHGRLQFLEGAAGLC